MPSLPLGGAGLTAASTVSAPQTISGLQLWLDAQSGTDTVVNDAGVGSWTDRQGAIPFTQATAGNRPLYKASGMNSLPTIFFDGSNDRLDCASNALSVASGNKTILIASNPTSVAGSRAWFDSQTGRLALGNALTGANTGWYDGSVFRNVGGAATTGAQVIAFVLNSTGTAGAIYRDGVSLGSAVAYTARALGAVSVIGGAYDNLTAWPFSGHIGEILIYDSALSNTDRNTLEAYLKAKWGTP